MVEGIENYLPDAILDYISHTKNPDSGDIVDHFKLRVDITLKSLKELENNKKIIRKWNGRRHVYEASP